MELKELEQKAEKIIQFFKNELSSLRVGRATPSLVENIIVDYYNSKTPLIQLASINVPEPKLIVIQPWEKNVIKEIEKAINASDLGINPVVDGDLIRLSIPPMTEERRKDIVKSVQQKSEETKLKIRALREEAVKDLKNKKNKSQITEDDFYTFQDELQKLIEEFNDQIKETAVEKEKEVMTV